METSSTPSSASLQLQCQVVLSLAHLLHQQSPRYDSEKNALLSTSAQCALQVARRAQQQQQQQQQQGNKDEDGSSDGGGGGEVHLFLTGSPRPTFAETNAWLLESYQSPAKNKSQRNNNKNDDGRSSSSNDDGNDNNNNAAADTNDNIICGNKKGGKVNNADEPLVGHAVVNAISQTSGIGLKCIRSKMLQGTIDRPEWDQTRWTDGECLFSELIGLVGLESFEGGSGGAGGSTTIVRGKKATNLSANLITVSSSSSSSSSLASSTIGTNGMGEDTFEEIARNVLRCLRRRQNSPPASVIYLLVPPDELNDEDHNNGGRSSSSSKMASSRLMEAFDKLEKYNDMIGVQRLMADARLEVVHVSTLPS